MIFIDKFLGQRAPSTVKTDADFFELKMIISELKSNQRTDALVSELVDIWEDSVRATHSFLTHADIETIKLYVPHAIKAVPHLFVARENTGSIHGFLGISGQKIEMLFIASQYRGKGLGKKLIREAMSHYPITDVVVNEQNYQAIGFYEHMGFEVYDRSATDEQGGPFPILFMRKP